MKNNLVEIDGCIFDETQMRSSHGYEALDAIGKESFVNHIHLDAVDRKKESEKIIEAWAGEMKLKWPGNEFRIYRQIEEDEITVRFHLVRTSEPNWCESGIEIIEIKT